MDLATANSSREEFYMSGTERVPAARLSNEALERALASLAAVESEATADVVEHVAEFERRRLFAPKSFPSMFEYCTKTLGYSEGAAYLRIYAGRLSREYPELLDLIRSRRLHLTALRTVGPHLTAANRRQLLSRCISKSERELKFIVAELAPKPEPMELVRRLPAADQSPQVGSTDMIPIAQPMEPPRASPSCPDAPGERARTEGPTARIEPLSARRVRFAFTGTDIFLGKVDRVRQILRHKHPAGSLEDVFSETVEFFLNARDPGRSKRSPRPRRSNPRRRAVPAWVKDIVFKRDDGRCAYRSAEGARCAEKGGLEYDHIVPWARGGISNDPANIRLLCRTHNTLEAERIFGAKEIARRKAKAPAGRSGRGLLLTNPLGSLSEPACPRRSCRSPALRASGPGGAWPPS